MKKILNDPKDCVDECFEGVRPILIHDDIASAPKGKESDRRGPQQTCL